METMSFADYEANPVLRLVHASWCYSPPGECPLWFCPTMKDVYNHILICNQYDYCLYPDCLETKILYNHFQSCISTQCNVCVPLSGYFVRNLQEAALPSSSENPLNVKPTLDHPQPCTDSNCVTNFQVAAQNPSSTGQVMKPLGVKSISEQQPQQCLKRKWVAQLSPPSASDRSFIDKDRSHSISVTESDAQGVSPVQDKSAEKFSFATGRTKSVRQQKVKAVSLTETFSPKMIWEHIESLQKCTSQSIAKSQKACHESECSTSETCQLCKDVRLVFQPRCICCANCGANIKKRSAFYMVEKGDTQCSLCEACYEHVKGDSVEINGKGISKAEMKKKINNEEPEELWVQCDKCESWQHQICALFNRRTGGGDVKYTCPFCCIAEIERRERAPLSQNVIPGASDLPTSCLSNHIEQRLSKRVTEEREQRAKISGKCIEEVPTAEPLVVRVVSSVDKTLEVKKTFLDIIQDKRYPAVFPYKSKAILLFQNIDGVEVCLFGMFVQEFGSDCQPPNQRRVYISYLDSVKYFRPDIKTATGEPLRTFVYHELLIGYLEYCKSRGFTSCYIWSSPPSKVSGDYILYCHPEDQKMPKSDKLREWYVSILGKAKKENIVISYSNLHDLFFVSKTECKAKVTAARLPYFDGDYLPNAVDAIVTKFLQKVDLREHQKGRKTAETTYMDSLLMQKLGKTISEKRISSKRNKENYIMVHLQHACTHCCDLMVSGNRWVCSKCENFQLCDKCHDEEQKIDEGKRHPPHRFEKHSLYPVEIKNVPVDTEDRDEVLESKFFDNRLSFLSLCEGNHYQYDTLRRAKHSSMMLLYHLHNPTAPAFLPKCKICHNDVDIGQGWGCEVCADYVVCNACHQVEGFHHPHGLSVLPATTEGDDENDDDEEARVAKMRRMLDLLTHSLKCELSDCPDSNCHKLKGLLRHQCRTEASGGCVRCKKKRSLLQLHAHGLKVLPSATEFDDQSEEDGQGKVAKMRRMHNLLVHSSKCKLSDCSDPHCHKLIELLRHQCETEASGGCALCKKKWSLLQMHACDCKELECPVPYCKNLKARLREKLHGAGAG